MKMDVSAFVHLQRFETHVTSKSKVMFTFLSKDQKFVYIAKLLNKTRNSLKCRNKFVNCVAKLPLKSRN